MTTPDIRVLVRDSDYWGFVEHNGYKMFLGKNDCGIAVRLLTGLDYEPVSLKLWADLCKDAELALDIGAHTGIYSLVAFKSGAKRVCSVEPFYLNAARLDLNLRANGFNSAGVWLGCALDRNGLTELSVSTKNGYCSTGGKVGNRENASDKFVVPCVRMDDLITSDYRDKVGPVKIDVETSAKQVLAGMTEILKHKPDLLIEVTEDGLTEILKPYGYRFYLLDDENGISEVESLEPELLDGKPNMTRLNRLCTVKQLEL